MSVQTSNPVAVSSNRVEWASVPRVNLLPAEILERRAFRVIQKVLAGVVLATLVLIAGGYAMARISVIAADQSRQDAVGRSQLLNRQKEQYAEVPMWQDSLANATTARNQAMVRNVDWAGFLDDLAASTPAGVTLTSVTVSMPDGKTLGLLGDLVAPDPLLNSGIGTISVSGTTTSYPTVAAWLRSFTAMKGVDISILNNATRADPQSAVPSIQFTTQIVVSKALLATAYPDSTETR